MDYSSMVGGAAPPSPSAKNMVLTRTRSRRWQRSQPSRTGTAVVVLSSLIISTAAWICLVFSGTTSRCLHHLVMTWEVGVGEDGSTTANNDIQNNSPSSATPTTSAAISYDHHDIVMPLPPPQTTKRSVSVRAADIRQEEKELKLSEIVFGIAGSSQLWERRKEFVRLWWRPQEMRGHVWLEERVPLPESDHLSLPPIMLSEDTSRFRYTNPTGHPSGLRIARIISESCRLSQDQGDEVKWFVLGDDDTVFNVENLVRVLSKYDPREMVYVGGPSESHSANVYFSHTMAYGGGGIAISYPLAEALSRLLDDCLDRYHMLYGSDDRLHACISELGIPLSREHGFHQWDIRGNAHGLLSGHPIAPFVSIHHVEAVDPFYPGLSSLDSLKLFIKAMDADPMSFLQRSICYDHAHHLSFSVSLGYVVQVFPNIILPRTLDRSELTHSAWNWINHLNEFDLDMREAPKSVCKRPILFFLKDVERQGNVTSGSYARARSKDDLKRKFFCFPHSPPLPYVKNIQVLGYPLAKNWHLAPHRLCCRFNQTSNEQLNIHVQQCEKGSLGAFTSSLQPSG